MIQQNKMEWKEVKLGDKEYFEILSSGINKFQGEKNYLSTESIKGTKIEKIECKITNQNRPSRANMQPVLNSVWFAKMKSTLKVYSFSKKNKEEADKYILSTGFAGIKFNEEISSDYVKFFLLTKIFNKEKDKLSTGSTQSGINNSFIARIKISLPFSNGTPDLKEQEKIVSILAKAETLKQKGKNAGDLFDEYLKSVFAEMFYNKGFEEIKLDKICELKSGGTPSRTNKDYFKGEIPWITTVVLGKKYIDKKDAIEFITLKAVEESATKIIPKNSILIGTRVGVGKISINLIDICTSQDIISLTKIDKRFINEYLLFLLNDKANYFISQVRGATIKGIPSSVLKSLQIPFPPLPLQQKFASIVEQVEKMKENVRKTKHGSEELFNSLMQKAFRGELK